MLRLLALLLLLVGAPAAAADRPLRIYAAASLAEAANDAADAWARRGHPRPVPVLAASSVLARQIDAGAPADLFLSADVEWMDWLAARDRLAPGTRRDLLTNRLALVVPAAEARRVAIVRGFPFAALLGTRRWVTADPDSVPLGRYARAALTSLGAWQAAAPRLVRAENARAALAFVERGDAAAGVVYLTDARVSARVAVAGVFPATSHPPIIYPAAIPRGRDGAQARAFAAWLAGLEARRLFAARGFGHYQPGR